MDERNLNIEKERRIFRKAKTEDISAIVEIYSQIHEEEKRGSLYVDGFRMCIRQLIQRKLN